jgi:predicted MPP superfamily phosphohydrolase
VVVGGDIAVADQIIDRLGQIEQVIGRPIYFVLGNHDYYGGSIAEVRDVVSELAEKSDLLHWLPTAGVVSLTESTALIGHGCWADGRAGDFSLRPDLLTDYFVIDELKGLEYRQRLAMLNSLGDESASHLRKLLTTAMESHSEVFLLTHVPPFADACWHEGRKASDDTLPHFVCKAVGDLLLELLKDASPGKCLTVLSGHTHGESEVDILPNLKVVTAKAQYGLPEIHRMLEIR